MKGETKIGTMADWTLEERAAKEKEWRQALFTLRLQKATGQLDNPMKIKSLRRDIARLKTLAAQGAQSLSAPPATAATAAAAPGGAETKAPTVRSAKPAKKAAPAARKATKAPARKLASKAKAKAKPKAKAKAKA